MDLKHRYITNGWIQRVTDGDSIRIDADCSFRITLGKLPVRLCGPDGRQFNADEWTTPTGAAAKDWLSQKLPPATVVVFESFKAHRQDRYERWLACVWVAGEDDDLATQMVALGHGVWVP